MAHPLEDPVESPRSPKRVKRPIVSNPRNPIASTGHEGNTTPTSSPATATAATAPPLSPLPIIELLDWHLDRVLDDFEVNESTENVNRVRAAVRDGLRPKTHAELASERNPRPNPQQPVEDTPIGSTDSTEVWNWEDAPVIQPRSFKVVRVEDNEDVVKAAGVRPKDSRKERYRSIIVKDESNDDPELRLYGASKQASGPLKTRDIHEGGALIRSVCATEEEASEIGEIACKLLNRIPIKISARRLLSSPRISIRSERCMIEARALDVWRHSFDRSRLPVYHRNLDISDMSALEGPSPPGKLSRSVRCFYTDRKPSLSGVLEHDVKYNLTQSTIRLDIHWDRLDIPKLNALPDAPASFTYGLTASNMEGLPHNATPEETQQLTKAYRILLYALSFKVGTIAERHDRQSECANGVERMTRLSQSTRGFTQQAESNGDVSIRPVPGVLPSTTAALPILVIRNGTASPVTVAYVLEQIYSALRNGINIVDAYLKGAIAADNVSLGRISLARVKQEHCTCSDEDTKSKNSHVCMCCAQRRVCATLTATADARLLCLSCLTKEERDAPRPPAIPPPNTSRPLMVRSTFRLRLTYMIQSAVASEPNINRDLFRAQLFRSIIDLDEGSWIDDYHGERNDNDARYEEGRWPLAKGSGDQASALLPHFAQLSIDAVRSVILVDGRPVYHHEDNFATTTFAINLVKYTYPPCILSALRALALYTLATKDADMVSPDPFPTELNHWMDRVHHISLLVPRSLKSRLHPASELSEKDMDIYQESCRTSLLRRGQESPYPGHKGTLYTADDKVSDAEIKRGGRGPLQDSMYSEAKKAASRIKQNPTPWQPWTKEQIATMLRIIGEIQRDPEANPYGIEIPTGGGGAPWPFTLEHMFEDDDLWDWWFHEIEDRYWRMFWFCNCEYDIDESPMTILLLIVIQWFKNGGKYDWLRCEMTVWVGHPFRFVLARAGEPGLPMKTGFTTTAPTSFKDYNAKECTIAVQPHVVNMLWWQFPVSTHPQLFLLLTGLLEQTVHYDAFRGDASSAPQYPEFSAVHRRRHRTDVSRPEELDVDLEEWALRQLEEDQRDEESGDDAQPEEVGEAADVGGLRSGLRDCRKRLRESGLDYRTDGFIQSQLYALHLAMADVDAVKFWDIIDMIDYHCTVKQAAKTSTSADQPQQIQSTHPASKKRGEWNLTNINNTCYIDSSVGILNHLPQIRDLMSNDANIIAKSEEKSGRSAGEYLPKHYSMSAPPGVRLQYAAEYMRNAEKLFKKIADVGRLVSSPAGPVDRQHSVALFNLVHAINPKEFHNKSVGSVPNTVQNDSLTLFHYLLEVVNAVTDDSSPSDRGRLARLEEREDKNFIDNKLEHYTQAMSEHWDAYSGKGKVSAITKFFAHQTVMERQCVVPGCYRIVRLFRHATSFPMALPPKGAPVDEFALLSMLEHTLIDDTADGTYETMLHCGFLPSLHTAPLCQYRKITILPKILMFSFNRQQQAAEGGADEELNKSQIDITEYLNMSRYSNDVELPSDRDTKQHATVSDKQPCIYRLTSINMYIPTIKHYVAYIVVDGEWLVFDDMYPRDRAAAEHPQVAINKGWLPCYVIYEQKDKTELPVDHAGQVTTGHLLSAKSGSARVPKPKVHDLYTPLTPEPVDDEMEDAGFQAGGDDTGHPNNQIANLLESGDRQILALVEKQMGAIVEERVSAIVKEQMGAIIEERVDAIVEQRVDALTWKHNDNLALNVDKIIKKVANRLNVGGNEVHQAMKEHRDGLFKEMTEQRDVLSQSMKEQRDELLHAMTELEDEKNKWWSEGSKGERLAVELHDRRQEDASQQIRKAALEERTLQQQDFDAKAGLMQKDFDAKAGLMQKDFDDKAREMQADFKEKAKQAQVAADSHTTHMVEKMAKEIELVTQRARENDDTEHARRMKEAAEGYSRHAKQQAKIKLEALAAEDAVQEAAQKVASETRRVARERQDEEQRAALEAQKRTREAEDKAQLAMLQAQQAARDAQRKALEQELAE